MKKIIIVGTAGAGKTTLAKKMSRMLNINHIELDSIYHQKNWQPIGRDDFLKIIDQQTRAEAWIFCGNYFSRLGLDFWKKADAVIWLDYPFSIVFKRVVLRTLKRGTTRQLLWNGNRESLRKNFLSKDSVIRHTMLTWRKQKERYGPLFVNQKMGNTTMIRLTNDKQVKQFLADL
jgi:adenylate kinase family enzyme